MSVDAILRNVWLIWVVSWFAASRWSGPTVQRAPTTRQSVNRLFLAAGAIPLFALYPQRGISDLTLVRIPPAADLAMVVVAVLGLSFTWWARIHLGRFWSGSITRKADHRIIDTGPYRFVRHPIYTGLMFAVMATAVVRGTLLALLGASSIVAGLYFKARLEERFLREQLGREIYDAYAQRVPMLVPLARR